MQKLPLQPRLFEKTDYNAVKWDSMSPALCERTAAAAATCFLSRSFHFISWDKQSCRALPTVTLIMWAAENLLQLRFKGHESWEGGLPLLLGSSSPTGRLWSCCRWMLAEVKNTEKAQLRRMRRTKSSLLIFLLIGFSRPEILSAAPAAHFALGSTSVSSSFIKGPFCSFNVNGSSGITVLRFEVRLID